NAAEFPYGPPAYAAADAPAVSAASFHPQLAFRAFGLSDGATNWLPLGPDVSLRSGEHYFLRAETFTPGFLYIFSVDSSGELQWLFPANSSCTFSLGANPVPPRVAITLPSGSQSYQLDDHDGTERLFAVFSATRWKDLEDALQRAGGSG